MRRTFLSGVLMLFSLIACAQVGGALMSFPQEKLAYNPALTGILDLPVFQLYHYGRWSGFEGAPTSQEISFQTPLPKDQVAIGFRAHFSRMGVSQQWKAQASYAYRIKINERLRLNIGLSASTQAHRILYTKLDALEADDANLPMVNQSDYQTHFGLGFLLRTPNWFVGLSNPGIIQRNRNRNSAAFLDVHESSPSVFYSMAGVQLPIQDDFRLIFSGTLGYGEDWEGRLETQAVFKDVFWVSAAYHSPDLMDFSLGLQVSDQLQIQMNHLLNLNAIRQVASNSYGLGIRYVFATSFPQVNDGLPLGDTFSYQDQRFFY